MNKKLLERYRKQLEDIAERVKRTAAGLAEQVRTPSGAESGGGMSNVPLHLGDVGSEAYNQELGTTLLENETYIRDEAIAALDRINRGAFGRCENCTQEIPTERLDAIPYTRYCTPCASQLQSGRAVNMNQGRPDSWLGEPGHIETNPTTAPVRGSNGTPATETSRGSRAPVGTKTKGGAKKSKAVGATSTKKPVRAGVSAKKSVKSAKTAKSVKSAKTKSTSAKSTSAKASKAAVSKKPVKKNTKKK